MKYYNLTLHIFPIIIIDVGVSYTTAAYNGKGGVFTLVKNQYGNTKTPSVVAFLPADTDNNNNNTNTIPESFKVLIGEDAEAQRATNPANTIYDWEQWTFRPFNQTVIAAVESQNLPYKIVQLPTNSLLGKKKFVLDDWGWPRSEWSYKPDDQAVVQVTLGGGSEGVISELHFRPESLTAMMIHHMYELAVKQIGNDKTNYGDIYLTVSGELDGDQRQAVKQTVNAADEKLKASEIPRYGVRRVMIRQAMVPMAYGLDNDLIYGIGGVADPYLRTLMLVNLEETFLGVDIMEVDIIYEKLARVDRRGEKYRFDEEAANRVVMERLVEEFLKDAGESLSAEMILRDDTVMRRLEREVVKMNTLFSAASLHVQPESNTYLDTPNRHTVRIEIESFFEDRDLSSSLDLAQWQGLRERSLKTIIDTIDEALEKSVMYTNYTTEETRPLNKTEVDHVVVMGSSPRIPEAIQLIERYFQGRLVVPQIIDPAFLSLHGASHIAWDFENPSPCDPWGELRRMSLPPQTRVRK